MQENTQLTPPAKEDEKLSPLANGVLTAAVVIVAVPVVAYHVIDAVILSPIDDGLTFLANKASKKAEDAWTFVADKANKKAEAFLATEKGEAFRNKVKALGDEAETFLASEKGEAFKNKVEAFGDKVKHFIETADSADSGNAKLAKGAGKVAYGLARGGFAISGALGHGLSGYLFKQNSLAAKRLAGEWIKHGFEAAGHNIREGSRVFKQGLDERLKK
jgi:hypothetical protein